MACVKKPLYNCSDCPSYCCSYGEIEITEADIRRLAKHTGVSYEQARLSYTKPIHGKQQRQMRHQQDELFKTVCMMLDTETRKCTVYDGRPSTCRIYPNVPRCGYWELIKFERNQQSDPTAVIGIANDSLVEWTA